MQAIIALIIIVWAVGRVMKASKKLVNNAPGKAQQLPVQKAAPAVKSEPPAVPVKSAEESAAAFDACGTLDESDHAPTVITEGESRSCDHGSLGGSMEVADHQGMGEKYVHAQQKVKTRVKTEVETTVKTQVHVNRKDVVGETQVEDDEETPVAELTPEQMRRAVVMAEILKRPCERRRRWSAR